MKNESEAQSDAAGLWYFAYGSNMSRAIFLERRAMKPLAIRRGVLEHYRLCFNIPIGPGERAVANLAEHTGATTHGVLYQLTSEDFDHLDQTEGVQFGLYRRIPIEVLSDEGQSIAAFTYQSTMVQDGRKPSARYLGLLLDGARHHGLPEPYLQFLELFELAVDERIPEP